MIYITKFRENDLNPSKGKQIEFNKLVVDEFFKFTESESFAKFECRSLADKTLKKKIQVRFKLSPARGDYKIYQNIDESTDLKDFFIELLQLSKDKNINDYFAIRKSNQTNYVLYYIPKEILFSEFFPIISGDQILYSDEDKSSAILQKSETQYEKFIAAIKTGEKAWQQIFYGAPGTGKSHEVKILTKGESVVRTTFHPDSDYSTFVGAYKPTTIQEPRYTSLGEKAIKMKNAKGEDLMEDRIVYKFVAQAFLQAYVKAWKFYADAAENEPKKQFLVIEEINRGNCAQIFGDLFQLLDRNEHGFSEYYINADTDLKSYLAREFDGMSIAKKEEINGCYKSETDVVDRVLSGEILLLPNNLYIWATMNTSDQSLFPIDSAFKRRWDWVYIPIANVCDKTWTIVVGDKTYGWWDFIEKINAQIGATTNSEDKKLGFFFCQADNEGEIDANKFINKVLFYLWNDVFKDYGFDGELFKTSDGEILTFDKFFDAEKGTTYLTQWLDKLIGIKREDKDTSDASGE